MKNIILFALVCSNTLFLNAQATFSLFDDTTFTNRNVQSFNYSDFDNDGDLDIFITGLYNDSGSWNEYFSELFENNGSGVLTLNTSTSFEAVRGYSCVADVNGDNLEDVLILGLDNNNTPFSNLYLNTGSGFNLDQNMPFDVIDSYGVVEFVDIDNDLDVDLFISGRIVSSSTKIAKIYKNDGNGLFTLFNSADITGVDHCGVDFGDIDGDNDVDIFLGGDAGYPTDFITGFYLNDGNGNFPVFNPYLQGAEDVVAEIVDVNNNDTADYFYSGEHVVNFTKFYRDGVNEDSSVPFRANEKSRGVEFVDVDGDSDLDVLVKYEYSPHFEMYINDGNGGFSIQEGIPFNNLSSSSGNVFHFFDFDGDNDSDLFIDLGTSSVIYENKCSLVYDTLITDSACLLSSYTFPDGLVIDVKSDTSHVSYLSSIEGCDSAVTTNLYLLSSTHQSVVSVTDQTLCRKDSIMLSYAGTYNDVYWSASAYLSGSGMVDGEINEDEYLRPYSGETIFYFSATDNTGCVFDSISVDVTENSYSYVLINGNPPDPERTYFCDDASSIQVTLQANHYATAGWGNIIWYNGVQDGMPYTISQGETYVYFSTSHPYGCVDTGAVTLTLSIPSNLQANAMPSNMVCDGNQVTLVGSGSNGFFGQTDYWWNGPVGDFDFYENNTPFTPTVEGYYTVTSQDSNYCHLTDSVYISIVSPVVGQVDPFFKNPMCLKDNTTLLPSAFPSGGNFYGPGVSNANGSFNPDWAGIGTHSIIYEYTDANGCESQVTEDIEVIESPDFNYSTSDLSVTLTANNLCSNYYWDFGDGNTNSLTTNPAYTYANPGTYSVCLVCNDISNCVNCINLSFPSFASGIVNGTIGIEEVIESENFSIFPNPNNGRFTLIYDDNIGGADVMLYSISGQLLDSYKLNKSQNSLQVDISNYESGIYFIHLKTTNDVVVKRIVKN
jgi:PKD repeat protein